MGPERELAVFRGPTALKQALTEARRRMGRPRKGERAVGTATKSLRLSLDEWAQLERLAEKKGKTVHALIRAALAAMVERARRAA